MDVGLNQVGQVAQLLILVDELVQEFLGTVLLLEADIDRLRIVKDGIQGLSEATLHDLIIDRFTPGNSANLTCLINGLA